MHHFQRFLIFTELYVKVHLLQNKRMVMKKKTTSRKADNAVFNESMTFNAPATSLQVQMFMCEDL